jgi:hypothetical protein
VAIRPLLWCANNWWMMSGCGPEHHDHPVAGDLILSETSLNSALAGLKECEWMTLENFVGSLSVGSHSRPGRSEDSSE